MKKGIVGLMLLGSISAFALEERYVKFEPTGGTDMVLIDSKPVIPATETIADQVRVYIKKSRNNHNKEMTCIAKYFDSASSSDYVTLYSISECK